MKCSNCGADLKEGTNICTVCGQSVSEEPVQENVASQPMQEAVQQNVAAQSKKPNKTGFKIGIAVAIVAALAIVGVAGAQVYKQIRKSMMSPAQYYQYVEKKNVDQKMDIVEGYYDAVYKNAIVDSMSQKATMQVKLSDTAKSMLSLTGVDFSKLESAEIEVNAGKEGDAVSSTMVLKTNDQPLLTMNAYSNYAEKKSYIQIPELSKSYLDASKSLEEASENEEMKAMMKLTDMSKLLPETKSVVDTCKKYTDMCIESAKDVEKKDAKLSVNSIDQKTTELTVSISDKDAKKLAVDILKALQDDTTIQKYIENIDSSAIEEYKSSLSEMVEQANQSDDLANMDAEMIVNVNNSDEIVGRTIKVTTEDGTVVIKCLCPMDGNDFACEYSVQVDDVTYVTLSGKGTKKSGVINGEYTLSLDDSLNTSSSQIATFKDLLKIKVENYDLSDIAKGEVSGTITCSSDAIASIANYSFKIKSEGDLKNAKSQISVLAGKDELLTMNIKVESGSKYEVTKPSDSDTVYDVTNTADMLQYQSEMDIAGLLTDIQDKTGIDMSTLSRALLSSYSSSLGSESYDQNSLY